MNRITRNKALQYAKFRLPYSAEAVKFVIDTAKVGQGIVADIGAGTGLLSQHFVGKVQKLFVIEPEPEMLNISRDLLGLRADIEYIVGVAEDTKLQESSVDLIVAANAYHRFQPESTIREFKRILKPNGMIAIFSYHDDFNFFRNTMQVSNIEQYNKRLTETRHTVPIHYFYGDSIPSKYTFKQEHIETWDEYWGAVISGIESPNEYDDWYVAFQDAHEQRFNSIATCGVITIKYSTEVWLGQPKLD